MWQSRVEIEHYSVAYCITCVRSTVTQYFRYGRGSYALCKLMNTWHIYTACMGPTPNGSSALQHFERGNAIEIHNRIVFDFYPGLPHMYSISSSPDSAPRSRKGAWHSLHFEPLWLHCAIPYSGKLSRVKTFTNFKVLWLFAKRKIWECGFFWWYQRAIHETFLHEKSFFLQFMKSFLPRKLPALRYYMHVIL